MIIAMLVLTGIVVSVLLGFAMYITYLVIKAVRERNKFFR